MIIILDKVHLVLRPNPR